jgi:hypothetical protein
VVEQPKSVGRGLPKYLQKGYNPNNESDEKREEPANQKLSRDK